MAEHRVVAGVSLSGTVCGLLSLPTGQSRDKDSPRRERARGRLTCTSRGCVVAGDPMPWPPRPQPGPAKSVPLGHSSYYSGSPSAEVPRRGTTTSAPVPTHQLAATEPPWVAASRRRCGPAPHATRPGHRHSHSHPHHQRRSPLAVPRRPTRPRRSLPRFVLVPTTAQSDGVTTCPTTERRNRPGGCPYWRLKACAKANSEL